MITDQERRNLEERIAELTRIIATQRAVIDAANNLIAQRGRHNTEIAYKRLENALKG